jgi:hypothetical protein
MDMRVGKGTGVYTSREQNATQSGGLMKGMLAVLLFAFVFATVSFAQGASNPDLSGTWLDSSNSAARITFKENGDKIHVHEQDGDKVIADYSCNLSGQPCNVNEDGHPVKVILYYNGSKLVEITERGNEVDKRRFSLGQDGKTMLVENIPLSSEEKTSTRTYQKEVSQVAKT